MRVGGFGGQQTVLQTPRGSQEDPEKLQRGPGEVPETSQNGRQQISELLVTAVGKVTATSQGYSANDVVDSWERQKSQYERWQRQAPVRAKAAANSDFVAR